MGGGWDCVGVGRVDLVVEACDCGTEVVRG